ncbi:lysine-tRNA ligase [Sporothrix schenckii ATCC 58251]|uniref:Lysyl-tRNA synthetase n=1 Tax=Sporothrix schenckii (strain ATCC 58251 / de Perez 2211183) TaxID=1391915 RepID=U7PQ71_SPOS1|nr:lysine-tRNA ligase [Sporothrix schenckii ATCC 58251]
MSAAVSAALPGLLFLRPYAARHIQSAAARSCSPSAKKAYLRFYQTACGLTEATPKRSSSPRGQTMRLCGARLSSSKAGNKAKADSSEAFSDSSVIEDRSAVALRVKELANANALHYPRYQPRGDRLSVPQFRAEFDSVAVGDEVPGRRVELSGRVLSVQRLGAKLVFLKLVDEGEQVQVMCNLRQLRTPADANSPSTAVEPAVFKEAARLLNRGDHVAVTGRAMRTGTGELTLAADALPRVYSPALAPLPTHLLDSEKRALRRHIDLLVNPTAAATLRLRSRILREMRAFFEDQQFVEVQTPILADLSGGAVARPFMTAHAQAGDEGEAGAAASAGTSAGSRPLSLRIAPELWLKRLVVGGLDRVFEIGPSFRNEGIDATHNPEFSTCEFYAAYWTLPRLMAETERLMAQLAQAALQFKETPAGAGLQSATEAGDEAEADADAVGTVSSASVDSVARCAAGGPFVQLEFIPSLEAALGITFPDLSAPDAYDQLRAQLGNNSGEQDTSDADGGRLAKLLDRLAGDHLEPRSFANFDGPLFITHHPACMSPLAKSFVCPQTGQLVAARAELFVDGRELANMYEEENDPAEQRRKMAQQVEDTAGASNNTVDDNYIAALESGLPPTGGWGCGVERLVMLFAGARRIADCLSFGTLRHVVAMKK